MHSEKKYYLVNKPYGYLSQFTDKEGRKTLSDISSFPNDVYPIGRLDYDSEGLLLLSNDKPLVDFLLNPKTHHEKEYYVQIEGVPEEVILKKLKSGVKIKGELVSAVSVKIIMDPGFPPRIPPVRERKTVPTSWISLTLTEGKNRQVRRMTAAAGYPTLRLVRVRIKNLLIKDLMPGDVRELSSGEIKLLKK